MARDGGKSASIAAKALLALLKEPTWRQSELARHCGVTTKALRTCLNGMRSAGIPLEEDNEPANVHWSVPHNWLPRLDLDLDLAAEVVRLVARLPHSIGRDRALTRLAASALSPGLVTNLQLATAADETLRVLEDAQAQRLAVRMAYYTASRNEHGIRVVSVQRVFHGERARIVAHCHRRKRLCWFRIDGITGPKPTTQRDYVPVDAREVEAFIATSLDGFASSQAAVRCHVFIRTPDANWALKNLPPGPAPLVTRDPSGANLTFVTSALDVLARFIVGFGPAATVLDPPELRARVEQLARGALANLNPKSTLNDRPVRPLRRTRAAQRLSPRKRGARDGGGRAE